MKNSFTFKQLVKFIHDMRSKAGFDGILADIDSSFEAERITFEDHEILYNIAYLVYKSRLATEITISKISDGMKPALMK